MREQKLSGEIFDFGANHLSLDFTNTLRGRADEHPREHLKGYISLLDWNHQARLVTDDEVALLLVYEQQHPEQAKALWGRAIVCREALFRIFSRIAEEHIPAESDVQLVNAELAQGMCHARLIQQGDRFVWGWEPKGEAPASVLWSVVREAADLLASNKRELIRTCSADDCNWMFLDTSKNHSRRWCDMKSCGNRAKARHHYKQKKQVDSQSPASL